MDDLLKYRKMALKLAETVDLGQGEGYAAKIPGFKGLMAVGGSKKEALIELSSALEDWVSLALKRGMGLPALTIKSKPLIKA